MKKSKQFKEGDKVFAKIKGYPAWPAIILEKKGQRFKVQFYGTRETGSVKGEELYYYLRHRDQLIKHLKKKEFKDAVDEIEEAIAQAGGTDGGDIPSNLIERISGSKRKRRNSEKSNDSQLAKKSENSKSPESDREIVDDDTSTKQEIDTEIDEDNRSVTDSNIVEDDVEISSNLKLVSEKMLEHWSTYADYVKEHPTLYNSRAPYTRDYSSTQCLPVMLPSTNKYIGLKLHKQWPIQQFQNEYENALYDQELTENLLKLKQRLENNEIQLDDLDTNIYLTDHNLMEDDIKRDFEMKMLDKQRLVERLRNEGKFVGFDREIKCSLKIDKAEPERAITVLKEMLTFEFYDEIMLKKHSHIIETIRRLRKYIGNLDDWNLNEEELENFNNSARTIRQLANDVYQKIKDVVKLPAETENFWEGFNNLVAKFKEDCTGLTTREIYRLSDEPYSRNSIIERLEQKDLLEDTVQHEEEENSSDIANTENKIDEEPEN